ncbi:hypothetical protein FGIG_03958 [Fasciola gigantica]|uniref:Uncharacterized protein n=1 Tax=Fasciola gigantica TaxID=46835 RepID=A0A504Z6V6_FASGI|nr:hypothetical protein FGIG_03958 [Fasciola gigantica]
MDPVDAKTVANIMHKWSIALIDKFRRFECATYALDALYVRSGVVLSSSYEDVDLPLSVNEVGAQSRVIQYDVLLGLEHRLGLVESKCYGLVENGVTEYMLVNAEYKLIRVPCEPYRLDQMGQSIDQLMSEHFCQPQLVDSFENFIPVP